MPNEARKKDETPVKNLKLGIIGLSTGNGHPYSWSAIFNGYDHKYMQDCPFPAIPDYLSKQRFPEAAISNARVTQIWTQEHKVSEHVAKSAKIDNIATNYEDLIGKVDAVLLARDDYEKHYEMSIPFIEAMLPVYIDKPIAVNTYEAERIFASEKYSGQVFTCSALRFASEFSLNEKDKEEIGDIKSVSAHVSGPWDKYAIHIIEPVLKIIGDQGEVTHCEKNITEDSTSLKTTWSSGVRTEFSAIEVSKSPMIIRIFGEKGEKELIFGDTFNAFKSALQEFVSICLKTKENNCKEFSLKTVSIIEKGLK